MFPKSIIQTFEYIYIFSHIQTDTEWVIPSSQINTPSEYSDLISKYIKHRIQHHLTVSNVKGSDLERPEW